MCWRRPAGVPVRAPKRSGFPRNSLAESPATTKSAQTEQSHRQQHQNQKRHQPGCFRMCWKRSAGVPVRAPKRSGAPTEQPGRKPRDDEVGATEQSHRQQHQNQKRHQPGCFRMCWRRSAGVPVRAPKRSGLPRNSLAESPATTKSAQQSKATASSTKTKSATSQAVSECAGGGQLACRFEHRSGATSSVVSIGAQNRCVRWPSPVHYGTAWSG